MSRRLTLTPAAQTDLTEIWDYTEKTWSLVRATSYFEGLDGLLHLLALHPEIARERSEFTPPVRLHPYGSHLLIYTADDDSPCIIRVVHSRANWHELLRE